MTPEFSRFCEVVIRLDSRIRNSRRISQGRAAELLNVSREHLNRVLNGRRQSRSLLKRYQQLETA